MLSSIGYRPLRSTIMQLSLPFPETPPHQPPIWEHLDERQRAVVLDKLAQLITKAAANDTKPEDCRHE